MEKLLFFIIASLIFCSCSNDDSQKLLDEQSKSLESGFELIDKNLQQLKKEVFYLLSDDAKQKYRPIGSWIKKTSTDFSKIYDWINEQEKLIKKGSFLWSEKYVELDSFLKKLKLIQQDDFTKIMKDIGKKAGLKENEIVEWIDESKMKLSIIDSISNNLLSNQNASKFSKNILIRVKSDLKILEKKLMERMAELTGGKLIKCSFGISPLIFTRQNIVKRGEVFKADISIHPYDHGIFQSDIEFKIDGKIIDFSKGRYFKYVSEPILEKQKTITISCKIRNRNTGKLETAFPDYEYIINTIE